MKEKLLANIDDKIVLFLYEGILKKNGIPYRIKQKGMDGYMKIILGSGAYSVPADIYVPEECHEKAVELTEVVKSGDPEAPFGEKDPYRKKKMIYAWITAAVFLAAVLLIFILTNLN
jgi:hypothetical protein